jgi:putative heme iron utilization protein
MHGNDDGDAKLARRLIRGSSHGALATSLDGRPYASLVATACAADATPLLLLSDLAQHARNLAADPRLSLLFAEDGDNGDPLAAARVSVLGRAERCDDPRLAARFAARHPASGAYAGFADFRLYRVAIERGHLVAGFGHIAWIAGEDLRFSADADMLAAAEADLLADVGAGQADALALHAAALAGRDGAGWRLTGIDPEGIDLRRAAETARLDFAAPVLTPQAVRAALAALVTSAAGGFRRMP